MADKIEKFFLFARVFAEKLPDMIFKSGRDANGEDRNAQLKTFFKYLSLLHPAFGLVNLFVPQEQGESQLQQIKRMFDEVNTNMKRLENELKMGIEHLKVFTAMSHIQTGFDAVVELQTSTNPDSWKSNIQLTQGPTIEKDLNVVLDALSIFETLYNHSNGNRQEIVDLGAVLSVHVMSGLVVSETCESIKPAHERRPDGERTSRVSSKFQRFTQTVRSYTDRCEENVSANMEADVESLLKKNREKSISENCEILGNFLKLKYNWLRISVFVYDRETRERHSRSNLISGNSSTRGQILKLDFEGKNTVVRYYKSDGEITDELKRRVTDILDNYTFTKREIRYYPNSGAIVRAFKAAEIPCESLDVYPSSVLYCERERVSHFGMDVVYWSLHQYACEERTRNGYRINMPIEENVDYFVNLNTIYTADIIGVADPASCILL
jgi:hypothetical protein